MIIGPVLQRRGDEVPEQRVWVHWGGFELGVKLARQEPGMVFQFYDLHQIAVGRQAADYQSRLFHLDAVHIVEFITMAVPLFDFPFSIRNVGVRVFS